MWQEFILMNSANTNESRAVDLQPISSLKSSSIKISSLKNSSEKSSSEQGLVEKSVEEKKLPGDLAMWFFILAELTVFAIFFVGFAVAEHLHADLFAQSKAQVHPIAGLINTLALITSSFMVALSLQTMHKNNAKLAVKYILYALFFACIYIVVKVWEYQTLFSQGFDIETNTFFTLYFLITFFHLMHVLLGMVILTYMAINAKKGRYSQGFSQFSVNHAAPIASEHLNNEGQHSMAGFESGACYWHMVDLLWIILFPLIYII